MKKLEVYGRLTAVEVDSESPPRHRRWFFLCECGATVSRRVDHVRSGRTRSCGCLNRDVVSNRATTHGHSETTTYAVWQNMKSRCCNPKSKAWGRYGGRGIQICQRWLESFDNFVSDMGPRPHGKTLDRLDNNKGYSPDNCRWVTYGENNRNKRNTVWIEYDGVTMSLSDWAERLGLNYGTLLSRLRRNKWDVGRLLTEAPVVGKNQYSTKKEVP